jgi:hypothetical protein
LFYFLCNTDTSDGRCVRCSPPARHRHMWLDSINSFSIFYQCRRVCIMCLCLCQCFVVYYTNSHFFNAKENLFWNKSKMLKLPKIWSRGSLTLFHLAYLLLVNGIARLFWTTNMSALKGADISIAVFYKHAWRWYWVSSYLIFSKLFI